MTRSMQCERLWEAEAAQDGRLDGASCASFHRHTSTCSACARERAALAALQSAAHALAEPRTTPLDRRRLRAEILRRANRGLLGRPSHPRVAAAAFVVAVAIVGFMALGKHRRETTSVDASLASPRFEIANVSGGAWQTDESGAVTRVSLHRGTASTHVLPLRPGQRFLMELPDGELEVHGTRFVVHVSEGHTEDVDVTEGVVALRIRGQAEVWLMRGDRWARPPEGDAKEKPAASAVGSAPPVQALTPPPAKRAVAFKREARGPQAAPAGPSDFAVATAAFGAGAYAKADDLLGAFVGQHPADPRAEDAAFLRAVALARLGDSRGAAARAEAYLRSYPDGLRRHEAEAIAHER